jgi:RNA recognition motif-containing protein
VFVGNLAYDVTRDELLQTFAAAGKVVDAKVPTDRETGRPRGFAFVEFEDEDAAQKSIAMLNGKDLKGRPLRVNEAENRPPRPPGAGPAGPRPPYRSGSPPFAGPGAPRELPMFAPPGEDRARAPRREGGGGAKRRKERRRHRDGFGDDEY